MAMGYCGYCGHEQRVTERICSFCAARSSTHSEYDCTQKLEKEINRTLNAFKTKRFILEN